MDPLEELQRYREALKAIDEYLRPPTNPEEEGDLKLHEWHDLVNHAWTTAHRALEPGLRVAPPAGSVSSGTMRPEDLIPAFWEILELYAPEHTEQLTRTYSDRWPVSGSKEHRMLALDEATIERNPDDAQLLLHDLFDALGEIAPDDCYFGANEGDGADYGFWSHDELMLQGEPEPADFKIQMTLLRETPDTYLEIETRERYLNGWLLKDAQDGLDQLDSVADPEFLMDQVRESRQQEPEQP